MQKFGIQFLSVVPSRGRHHGGYYEQWLRLAARADDARLPQRQDRSSTSFYDYGGHSPNPCVLSVRSGRAHPDKRLITGAVIPAFHTAAHLAATSHARQHEHGARRRLRPRLPAEGIRGLRRADVARAASASRKRSA
jgi:hypothetical protein